MRAAPTAVEQILQYIDGPRLRELAAVKDRQDPVRLARRALTDEGVEKLADILLAGSSPTVGFLKRYRVDA